MAAADHAIDPCATPSRAVDRRISSRRTHLPAKPRQMAFSGLPARRASRHAASRACPSAAPAPRTLHDAGIVLNDAGWNRQRKPGTTLRCVSAGLLPSRRGYRSTKMHVRHAAVAAGRFVQRTDPGFAYETRALSRREKTTVCLTGSKPTPRYRSRAAALSGLKQSLMRTAPASASRSTPAVSTWRASPRRW